MAPFKNSSLVKKALGDARSPRRWQFPRRRGTLPARRYISSNYCLFRDPSAQAVSTREAPGTLYRVGSLCRPRRAPDDPMCVAHFSPGLVNIYFPRAPARTSARGGPLPSPVPAVFLSAEGKTRLRKRRHVIVAEQPALRSSTEWRYALSAGGGFFINRD